MRRERESLTRKRENRGKDYVLINESPDVFPAVGFILCVHQLVRMPNEIDIQSWYEERCWGGRHQVEEPIHEMVMSRDFILGLSRDKTRIGAFRKESQEGKKGKRNHCDGSQTKECASN